MQTQARLKNSRSRNFHALQRVKDRVSLNLFTEQEQNALNTFLPGGTIDSIAPNVQRALGDDVMNTLREDTQQKYKR